jgi:CHAT domain-containing protein
MADRTNSGRVSSARTQSIWLLLALVIAPVVGSGQSTPRENRAAGLRLAAILLSLASNDRTQAEAILRDNTKLNTYAFRAKIAHEADLERDRHGFTRSLFLYDIAIQASRLSNDAGTLAICLYSAGIICARAGDTQRAEACYLESARVSSAQNLASLYSSNLDALADLYMGCGEYEKAKEISEKRIAYSLSLSSDYGTVPLDGRAGALAALGAISEWEGDHISALRLLRESLGVTLSERAPNFEKTVADRWSDLGWVYYSMGDYGRAMESYGKALELSQAIGYKEGLCPAILSLALVYLEEADYQKAEELSNQGLQIARELKDKLTEAGALGDLGYAYQRQGDYPQAERYFTEAVGLARTLPDSGTTIQIIEGLGTVYQGKGQYDVALQYYSEALKSAERIHLEMEQFELTWRKADAYLAMADYDKVIELCDAAVKLDSEMAQPDFSYLALTSRGEAYLAKGEYALAARDLSEAIDKAELIRGKVGGREAERASFLDRKLRPYQLMVDLLVAQNKPEEALAYSEHAKGRALLDALQAGRPAISEGMNSAERNQEAELNNRISTLNFELLRQYQKKEPDQSTIGVLKQRLAKARLDYDSFLDRIYSANPDLRTNRGESATFSAQEVAPLLAARNAAAVEFVVREQKTHIFVLTSTGGGKTQVQSFTSTIGSKALSAKVREFRDRIAAQGLGIDKLSAELFEMLLGPAKDALQGKSTIVLVPDGPLWELPFQALRERDGRYLIEDHSVFYVASLGVLKEMMNRKSGTVPPAPASAQDAASQGPGGDMGLLLAFGNPTISAATAHRSQMVHRDAKLSPLPDAEREANVLRDLYGASNSRIYVRGAASKQNAEKDMGRFRILHFATHGILDNDSPLYSQLILSVGGDDASQDGFLEAREIMGMNLKADIAVLSACDTARGAVTGGQGVIGMSWAFFVAGCPTTVVSQWNVESRSTTELMIEFHRNLRAGNLNSERIGGSAEALRQAALTMLKSKEYRHPFYWAGFVVMGDGW